MSKKTLILTLLFMFLIFTAVLAFDGYDDNGITIKDSFSGSSNIVKNTTGTVKVDVNSISDTTGCKYTKVFIMNTNTGDITPCYNMYEQNSRLYSASKGNNKAVFKRGSSNIGTMHIDYDFSTK